MRTIALILLSCSLASGATYYVRTDGNNANAGTANSSGGAWRNIWYAAKTVSAGDTVQVQSGTFNEFVTNTVSGTAGNLISFVGSRDSSGWLTIIDPSTDISGSWSAAPEIGTGVYKKTGLSFTVSEMTITNARVAFVYDPGDISSAISQAYNTNWTTGAQVLALPAATSVYNKFAKTNVLFWDGIDALYCSTGSVCYLRLRDGSDPSSLSIRAAPNATTTTFAVNRPAIDLNAKSYIVWSNFLVRGAIGAVKLSGGYNVVASNYLANGYERIAATCSNSTIFGNYITTAYFGYTNPGAWAVPAGISPYPVRAQLYTTAKYLMGGSASTSYDNGIELSDGVTNTIAFNYFFGGLGVGAAISGAAGPVVSGTTFVSNTIANQSSVGILLSDYATLTTVAFNSFSDNGDANLRFHHINSGETNRVVWAYRNVGYQPSNTAVNIYFASSSGTAANYKPQLNIYFNSFSGGYGGMQANDADVFDLGELTNSVIVNNIFSGPVWFYADDTHWQSNWVGGFDYNLLAGPWTTYPNTNAPAFYGAHNIYTNNVIWNSTAGMSFPTPAQALNTGLDVTSSFSLNGHTFAALPSGATIGGAAWDMGAHETQSSPRLSIGGVVTIGGSGALRIGP